MSKTIRMEEEDSNKITIPPLSIDEEGEEVIMDLNEAAGSEEKALNIKSFFGQTNWRTPSSK